MKRNTTQVFKQLNAGLVPDDETIRAVIRAMPKGESARRSEQINARVLRPPPTPINHEGTAASWPNLFARHESIPDSWSPEVDWFFWVVITDKQLHAFEGHVGKGFRGTPTAGPEAAHYPLDQIAEIFFDKGLLSQLTIWFTDDSSVELELGIQGLDPWQEAIRPFEQADSERPRGRTSGLLRPGFSWLLGLALLIGGMAVSIGATADARTARFLTDHGVQTTAVVTGVDVGGAGGASSTTTFLDVEFNDEFGGPAEARLGYCDDDRDWETGDEVEVLYDPNDPTVMQFADCDYPTQETVAVAIGIGALVLGTIVSLRAWQGSGWKRRRVVGIPLVILGVLFVGTAYSDDCNCYELTYTGAALVLMGTVAQFGRSSTRTVTP